MPSTNKSSLNDTSQKSTHGDNTGTEVADRIDKSFKLLRAERIFKIYQSIPLLLSISLLKGIAFGLGSVLGATLVVSLLIWILSQVEFIPIIGNLIQQIISQLKTTSG